MNKTITYTIVAVIMFLLYSYENIIHGYIGASLTEEVVGFALMLLGLFGGSSIIERLLPTLDKYYTWNENPIYRFGINLLTIGFSSIILSVLIILGTWTFFESFGVPDSLNAKKQILTNTPDRGLLHSQRHSPPTHSPPSTNAPAPSNFKESRPDRMPPMPLGIQNPNFREAYKYMPELMFGSFLLLLVIFLFEESSIHSKRREINRFAEMQLAQEQMLSKINALKGQINPHFMFNNLNTLSGLIHEDIDRADRFIQSLSKNLRYVLEQNKEVMVSLQNEVEFIKSYIHLQEERFGHKLKIDIDIAEADLDFQLPALTLELLIENALKHNIVSSTNPLSIRIYVRKGILLVENSYQPKVNNVISTGIGLQNLQEQLSLLGIHGSSFGIEGAHYIARIPMVRLSK